jgi:hypothetical protein
VSQYSIYHVLFRVGNSAALYSTNVALSGGSRKDDHSPAITASLVTAITNNLSAIFTAFGEGTGTDTHGAPSGTVTIDSYRKGACPDCWV